VEGADCCVGSGGVLALVVAKTGSATGEPGPAMAAVVGNMASAAGADRCLIFDTKLLWTLLGLRS